MMSYFIVYTKAYEKLRFEFDRFFLGNRNFCAIVSEIMYHVWDSTTIYDWWQIIVIGHRKHRISQAYRTLFLHNEQPFLVYFCLDLRHIFCAQDICWCCHSEHFPISICNANWLPEADHVLSHTHHKSSIGLICQLFARVTHTQHISGYYSFPTKLSFNENMANWRKQNNEFQLILKSRKSVVKWIWISFDKMELIARAHSSIIRFHVCWVCLCG